MADIAHIYNNATMGGDLALAQGQLTSDDGLDSAILHSLFTDARARADDPLPDDSGDRRGWWGSLAPPVEGDSYGSRLWLLSREKQTAETLRRAEEYASEALVWLLADAVATRVTVTASYPRRGMLALDVRVSLADGSALARVYDLPVGGA